MRSRASRLLCHAVIAVALAAAFLVPAATASANWYTVYACGGPAGGANNLFHAQADAGMSAYLASCPVNSSVGPDNMGLTTRSSKQSGSVAWLAGAYWIMDAPRGAEIGAIHADVSMNRPYSDSPYWSIGIVGFGTDADRSINTNGGMSWGCGAPAAYNQCFFSGRVDTFVHKPSVRFETRCGAPNFGSCATYPHPEANAYVAAWNISVDVDDFTLPSISNVGGGLASGGWLHGDQRINWDSTDNSGIRSASLAIDGATRASWTNSCDYTQVKPCGDLNGGSLGYNVDGLSEGAHALTLSVTDALGNASEWATSQTRTMVDPTASPGGDATCVCGTGSSPSSTTTTWTPTGTSGGTRITTPTTRANAGLRITYARASRGTLVIRGRLRGHGRVTATARFGARSLRAVTLARASRFALRLRLPRDSAPPRRIAVLVRFAGDARHWPAGKRVTARP